ncbi:MAG: hypothetical protein AUK47_14590 [Deltaproteobacteria bacterium CG2_30_63_29]|nr:MAG: hypothetical protein AUK47_14590 [Deltaproteobacteria bacterium CG2_30_63_29]PIW00680.1 MAG: hypothetical protein COW42_07060 [Deltaproteobacteria bacterium CG17_big_fil_post_rev_8_21_14_2_50_63_7]PJB37240.1 MAG: hypothetical protein CO108_21645 [Deltaproteobacteria bacterium CG_4_9_14_3_um_filter_63_12]
MRSPDPNWAELKEQPFGRWLPEADCKYRADELRWILAKREELPLTGDLSVEIGTNRGRFLRSLCKTHPERTVFGIELKTALCGVAQRRLARAGLSNGYVVNADARLALPVLFTGRVLHSIFVLFPDPWWKKRHAKRRLLDPAFIEMASELLTPGGALVIKTDVASYAEQVREDLAEFPALTVVPIEDIDGFASWELTTRERHCLEDGLPIYTLAARTQAPLDGRAAMR